MSMIKPFVREGLAYDDAPGGQSKVLDKAAFRKFASEQQKAFAERTEEQANAALETRNRLVSSSAGVAELQYVEADYYILNFYRDNIALDFAEIRDLPLGMVPIYRTRYINPVGVFMGSIAGGGSTVYWATKDAAVQLYPFSFRSENVMVPNLNNIFNMEQLNQRRDALARVDEYMKMVMGNIAINTVLGATNVLQDPATSITNYVGSSTYYTFVGRNVYTLDPGVQASAVPTLNFYDLSSTENGLTKKFFQTVNTHSIKIGRNFNKCYIPTATGNGKAPMWEALQNMATPVALATSPALTDTHSNDPARAVPSEMWEQFQREDFRGSITIEWFGQRITIEKQNWMPNGTVLLFAPQPSCLIWDRLNLASGNPNEGTVVTPVDGFYSYLSKTKQIATARPDWCMRNFLALNLNA